MLRKQNIPHSHTKKSTRKKAHRVVASKDYHIARDVIPLEETETSQTEDDIISNSGSVKSTTVHTLCFADNMLMITCMLVPNCLLNASSAEKNE
jgi:hypothetical protein